MPRLNDSFQYIFLAEYLYSKIIQCVFEWCAGIDYARRGRNIASKTDRLLLYAIDNEWLNFTIKTMCTRNENHSLDYVLKRSKNKVIPIKNQIRRNWIPKICVILWGLTWTEKSIITSQNKYGTAAILAYNNRETYRVCGLYIRNRNGIKESPMNTAFNLV